MLMFNQFNAMLFSHIQISWMVFPPPLPSRPQSPDNPRQTHDTLLCMRRVPMWSGAAEYVEKSVRELEDTKILASNGSSAKANLC